MKTLSKYESLLDRRIRECGSTGFEVEVEHPFLFDFQKYLVDWSTQKGRAAIFADCGMGKTAMQLAWADNVVKHTGKAVLVLTPLAVSAQTVNEAAKFGLEATQSRDGKITSNIVVTNYERLHYFDPADFAGIVCDESSVLKNFKSTTKQKILDFSAEIGYRLLCTATAAPNDFFELGNSSEVLGYLGFRDMITTFFKQETTKDRLGWGRTKYRFRGHAEKPFWRWVCSWARALRMPSDVGFSDQDFVLPPLDVKEMVVKDSTPRSGMLFSLPARNIQEEREERRVTIDERCELLSGLVNGHDRPAVVWCHLNDEADLLEKMIPDAVQVSGSMDDETKESRLLDFGAGNIRTLITKPKIGCWGLNWQHCSDVYTFPSHSFEQYYQSVRRCWRFGQQNPVTVNVIATEGERGVVANLQRKGEQAEAMFAALVEHMHEELDIESGESYPYSEDLPGWL